MPRASASATSWAAGDSLQSVGVRESVWKSKSSWCLIVRPGRDYVTGEMWKSKPPFRCLAPTCATSVALSSSSLFLLSLVVLAVGTGSASTRQPPMRSSGTASRVPSKPCLHRRTDPCPGASSRFAGAASEALHWAWRREHSRLESCGSCSRACCVQAEGYEVLQQRRGLGEGHGRLPVRDREGPRGPLPGGEEDGDAPGRRPVPRLSFRQVLGRGRGPRITAATGTAAAESRLNSRLSLAS